MTGSGRSRAPQHKQRGGLPRRGSIRRIHRRQAQEIFAEKACAKDKIVEPIQQIHPTGKSPKTLSSPFRKNIPLNPSGKSVL
jgi:hypothetical protein